MIGTLLALGALAAWAVIATVELVARDGYGSAPVRSLVRDVALEPCA